MKTAVSGIKPSGTPHLGNYLGMIRPALRIARDHRAFYFIADAHALTTVGDPGELRTRTTEAAAAMLALGFDPGRSVVYRQSDVPEVFELACILSFSTPKGLLNRAHAYKSAVEENTSAGRSNDEGVTAGLFFYPVLMAADILLLGADVVPVGSDQEQHVEIARDIAMSFNRRYGRIFTVPEAAIDESVALITGLDGRKMSKSYGNVIPIFAQPGEISDLVARITTDSRRPQEPKDPDSCNVFAIYRHVAPAEEVEAMRRRYLEGGLGYAEAKQALARVLCDELHGARLNYRDLVESPYRIEEVLAEGAGRVRSVARAVLHRVKEAVGTGGA